MRISDLIKMLFSVYEQHGDLLVWADEFPAESKIRENSKMPVFSSAFDVGSILVVKVDEEMHCIMVPRKKGIIVSNHAAKLKAQDAIEKARRK
jgi:hypothetical protein